MNLPDLVRWQQLSCLLDEFLDLDATRRQSRLDALRAQDPLLASELESMLSAAATAEASGFLAGDAEGGSAATSSLVGRQIGAYVIESLLGQGGTGSVWRARRADGRFEGSVAVKLLHLSLIGRAGALRFEREGAILARLTHPHIARLLDAGVTPDGQPYLVLELVEGQPIDRHCDARRLNVEQRLALFDDVLAAVAHAHCQLVIHRDIKPNNILVTADGKVKLLDFGIAKMLQDGSEGVTITAAGRLALTPEYAAPEQVRGAPVTTATDVYALGVLLYRLLTGRHPTAPETTSSADVLRATLDIEPVPLTTALTRSAHADTGLPLTIASDRDTSLPRLRSRLQGDLENIVARTLRKDAAQRYRTVEALADDLRRHLAHEPVSARPDSLAYRSAKFVRRHLSMAVAGLFVMLAVAAGLAGTITQARRAEAEALQARHERDHALRDLAFANAARDLMKFLVSQAEAKPLKASELLLRAEVLTDQQYADDALTRGRLQLMLAIEYGNVGEFDKSKAILSRAQASAQAAGDPALLSNVDCLLAATLGDQNEPQRAMDLFGQAIQRAQAEAEPDRSVLAACLHMRADLHARQGRPQAMLDDALAAQAELNTLHTDHRVMADSIHMVIAEAYGRLGQTAKAIAAYEGSLADLANTGWKQTARMALRLNNFSRMLYTGGQALRAQDMAARGLEIARSSENTNELQAVLEGNDARALIALGRFDEAKAMTEHALASALERKDFRWAGTFALYGAPAWCATGDLARCASLLALARDKLQASLPPGHASFGIAEMIAAQLSLAHDQPAQAREQLVHAVAIFDAAKEKSPLRIGSLALLARTELRLGEAAEASQHAEMAVAEAREISRELAHTEWLGIALLAQGIVQQARGDATAARTAWVAALAELQATLGDSAPVTEEARRLLADG